MIERIVSFALRKRLVVAVVCIFVVAYGYYSWTQLSIEAYPDIADVTSQVVTQAPGLAAEEVEQQVTVPLERELNGTPGLVVMRSESTFGLSLITLVFKDGAEDYWSRQRVQERIQNVTLPPGITPGLDPLTSPIGEIYRYTLETDTKGLRDLSEIQKWIVIPALKQVPGVVDISNFGGVTTQFQLELEPAALTRFNVSLKNVTDAIQANSSNSGGSVMTRGELGYVVRGIGLVQTLDDLGNIVVTQRNGTPIFLSDLGKLKYSSQERHGILGKDGKNDIIEGIVLLLRGENPSRVIEGIHAKVKELNDQLKSQDVRIVPYIDRSNLVKATVDKVSHTIFEGICFVLFVLILFLGSPISAMIVAITIPFSMVVAFILMHLTNIPANLLSLGAIDFGIIVNAAIVIMESILRRREENPDKPLSEEDAKQAAFQVAKPIFFATLIIITAYFPLFAFQRVEAKLFSPMAYAVGYSLFGALVLSLTLVPGLAYLAYRKPRRTFHNPVLDWLDVAYKRLLTRSLGSKTIVFGLSGLVVAAVVVLGLTVGREFLPELDEGSIWLQVQLPSGISLETASAMAADLRKAALEFHEVSYVVTQLGRNDDGTDPFTPSHIESSVGLHPYNTWPSGETKQDLIKRMDARFKKMPGYNVAFTQPMIDGVYDKIAGAHSELVIKVFGDNFDELRKLAGDIVDVLNAVPGAADVAIDQEPPLPQVVIQIDRAAAARYGINVSDISSLIQTAIGGAAVSQVFIGDRQYDVTVRFPQSDRNSPSAIGNLVLTSSTGALIPLSQVAHIRLQMGESTIAHEMNHRHLTIRLNYRDRDLSSLLADAKRSIAEKVKIDPAKNHLEWGGQFENQERAQARLGLILALVLGMMFVLLYAQFGLVRHALLVLGVVPMATLGGLIALHVTGSTLNVASGVGFIALFGVAVENGIIMVANLNRLRKTDMPLVEAVIAGASERLRPILMTATVATVGMLPAAMATGIGSDVQRGLGTVIVWGLVTTTALSLLIIPALYYALEQMAARRGEARQGSEGKGVPGHVAAGISLLLASTALNTGCAVGPDFMRPALASGAGYSRDALPKQTASAPLAGGEAQQFQPGADIPGEWWKLFHSARLDDLIQRAIKANPDLAAAKAALRIAHENTLAGGGAYYPSVSAGLSQSRQRVALDLASPALSGASLFNFYTAQVSVSYVPDVFGGTRRSVESLSAQAESERFQLEAAYLTLTSNVVAAAVQEASLRGQIAATQRILTIERELLNMLKREKQLGEVAEADVAAQEAALAQVEQGLPALQKQLSQQRDLLTALSGGLPNDEPGEEFTLSGLKLPTKLPVSLPSKLVEQRPDIRAAEENLHSASAQIGVAVANRLPNLTLSADRSSTALTMDSLLHADTISWNLAAGLTQPIFQGGILKHRERAARAAYDQAAAQYRSTVNTAFQNVADALRALKHDANALNAADVAERAASRSLEITRGQLKLGQVSHTVLLNAEQTYQQAQINLIQAKANRYADTVALFQALGGGWWNRSDAPLPPADHIKAAVK